MKYTQLNDFLKFFLESANLDREPHKSLTFRLVVLRLLYSIRDLNIDACVATLHRAGIFIGDHDSEHMLNIHRKQHLTFMDADSFTKLLMSIDIAPEDVEQVQSELFEHYKDKIRSSPFKTIELIFQENFESSQFKFLDLIRVFLAIYNFECKRDEVIMNIITSTGAAQTSDMMLRIFGQHNSYVTSDLLTTDVCIILKFMKMAAGHSIKNFGQKESFFDTNMAVRGDLIQSSVCRFNLIKLRNSLLMQASATEAPSSHSMAKAPSSWKPLSLPIVSEIWESLSLAQQQLIILIAALKPELVENKDKLVSIIYAHHDENLTEFSRYIPQSNDATAISSVIFSILSRISFSVDSKNEKIIFMVNDFIETCFQNSIGQAKRNHMSSTLKVQLFICMYLTEKIQAKVYMSLIKSFNERAFQANREHHLPENISSYFKDCVQEFTQKHMFPELLVEKIFRPLCI